MTENMEEEKKERRIVHLEIDGKHEYYGCVASMFENHPDDLGYSQSYVRNRLYKLGTMQNQHCIIRIGRIQSRKQTKKKEVK